MDRRGKRPHSPMASPAKTPAREAKKAKNDAEMQCAATFDRASSEPVAVRESIEPVDYADEAAIAGKPMAESAADGIAGFRSLAPTPEPKDSSIPAARFASPSPELSAPPLHPPYPVQVTKAEECTKGIHIYHCGSHDPEEIAAMLAAWETEHGIDVLGIARDGRADGPDLTIPDRATTVVVAEDVLREPRGGAVFWATEQEFDEDTGEALTDDEWVRELDLKVGFYYGFERSEGAEASLREWADKEVERGNMSHRVTLGCGEEMDVRSLLASCAESFFNELCWREVGPPLEYASGEEKMCVYRKRGRADVGLEPVPVPAHMLGMDPRIPG